MKRGPIQHARPVHVRPIDSADARAWPKWVRSLARMWCMWPSVHVWSTVVQEDGAVHGSLHAVHRRVIAVYARLIGLFVVAYGGRCAIRQSPTFLVKIRWSWASTNLIQAWSMWCNMICDVFSGDWLKSAIRGILWIKHELEKGIGVIFWCGLNHWISIEVLFDRKAIRRGTRVREEGAMIQRASKMGGNDKENL